MNISITDLESNSSLDKQAMDSVLGGCCRRRRRRHCCVSKYNRRPWLKKIRGCPPRSAVFGFRCVRRMKM